MDVNKVFRILTLFEGLILFFIAFNFMFALDGIYGVLKLTGEELVFKVALANIFSRILIYQLILFVVMELSIAFLFFKERNIILNIVFGTGSIISSIVAIYFIAVFNRVEILFSLVLSDNISIAQEQAILIISNIFMGLLIIGIVHLIVSGFIVRFYINKTTLIKYILPILSFIIAILLIPSAIDFLLNSSKYILCGECFQDLEYRIFTAFILSGLYKFLNAFQIKISHNIAEERESDKI